MPMIRTAVSARHGEAYRKKNRLDFQRLCLAKPMMRTAVRSGRTASPGGAYRKKNSRKSQKYSQVRSAVKLRQARPWLARLNRPHRPWFYHAMRGQASRGFKNQKYYYEFKSLYYGARQSILECYS